MTVFPDIQSLKAGKQSGEILLFDSDAGIRNDHLQPD